MSSKGKAKAQAKPTKPPVVRGERRGAILPGSNPRKNTKKIDPNDYIL